MSSPARPSRLLLETGHRLAAIQEALGMKTAAEFAVYLGVQPNKLSQWKSGGHLADMVAMIRLAEKSGIPPDFVYRGDMSGVPMRYQARLDEALEKVGYTLPNEPGGAVALHERRTRWPVAPRE